MISQYEQMKINRKQLEIKQYKDAIKFFESLQEMATSRQEVELYEISIGHLFAAIHRIENQG